MGADVFNGEGTNIGMVGQVLGRFMPVSRIRRVLYCGALGNRGKPALPGAYQLDLHTKNRFSI